MNKDDVEFFSKAMEVSKVTILKKLPYTFSYKGHVVTISKGASGDYLVRYRPGGVRWSAGHLGLDEVIKLHKKEIDYLIHDRQLGREK